MNPLAGNPFRTRADAQRAVGALFEPLIPAYVAGGARVSLGNTGTTYDLATSELEAFARPLWGIVPLVAGGAAFEHCDLFLEGLARGTDPRSPQYWGAVGDGTGGFAQLRGPDPAREAPDQRMVEMAAIGLALALVPEHVFEPLGRVERERVIEWLAGINRHPPAPNNWQFFRVLVNLGFARVGGPVDRAAMEESLAAIDSYWLADGWYRDGVIETTDFYNAWALHFYGLIYAVLAAESDPARAARFRARARRFASDWEARFDASGRVVPFGRSLTYRFGAAAFWGALAFAREEAIPWGDIRGLWARHLRWWSSQPIARADGVLSIGWSHDDLLTSESYNGPGSPYWALKTFLPLALPDAHPFWSAPEAEVASEPRHSVQRPAVVVVDRDARQVQMLNGGRGHWIVRQGAAKYGKFAYSSAFGFALDPDDPSFDDTGDSMLVLRDPSTGERRVRASVIESGIEDDVVWSRWRPFADVEIVTVLCGVMPWHVRLHHLRTGRALETFEGGFAIGNVDDPTGDSSVRDASGGIARVTTSGATSIIADVAQNGAASRRAEVRDLQPNTSILWPRAVVPGLVASLTPGEQVLTCIVAAAEVPTQLTAAHLPAVPDRASRVFRAKVSSGRSAS